MQLQAVVQGVQPPGNRERETIFATFRNGHKEHKKHQEPLSWELCQCSM